MTALKMGVYTPQLELIGILESFQSLIFQEQAFGAGSFTVACPLTEQIRTFLAKENIIWFQEGTAGIIEYVNEYEDKGLLNITTKGRLLTGILDRRILWGRYDMTGTPGSIMRRLVDLCAINPTDSARVIPGLRLENSLPDPSSRLPTGYTELSYIQSGGEQYIDTGLKPGNGSRVAMDIDVLSSTGAMSAIFGGRDDKNKNSFCFWKINNTFRFDFGESEDTVGGTPTGRHKIDANSNVVTVDGTVYTVAQANFQTKYNLLLLSVSRPDGIEKRMASAKLYSCQIYSGTELLRDYVPCSNPAGSTGLYDLVSKTFFGNAGAGAFTAGPAATVPSEPDSGPSIRKQKTGGSLLETLSELGEAYNVAFGVRFDPEGPGMVFWTRPGLDRTVEQSGNEPAFFSTELDDVLQSEYTYDSSDYRNVTLVAGEGEGDDRVMVTVNGDMPEAGDGAARVGYAHVGLSRIA